jgi:hypothetical protein
VSVLHRPEADAVSDAPCRLSVEPIDPEVTALAVSGSCEIGDLPQLCAQLRSLLGAQHSVVVDFSDCVADALTDSTVRALRHIDCTAKIAVVGPAAGSYTTRRAALDAIGEGAAPAWRVVSERRSARAGTVELHGEWDIGNAASLEAALDGALDRGRRELDVELCDGAFVGLVVMHTLRLAAQRLARDGGVLRVHSNDASHDLLLEVSGLDGTRRGGTAQSPTA